MLEVLAERVSLAKAVAPPRYSLPATPKPVQPGTIASMRDTTSAAAAAQAQAQQQLGGPGRLRLAFEMSVLARELALAGLRRSHPDWSPAATAPRAAAALLAPRRSPPAAPVTAAEVFRRILGAVESAGIPYMLTGSFASSYHGAPRATQDIDLVIAPERAQLRSARHACCPHPSSTWTRRPRWRRTTAKASSTWWIWPSGWKADLIMRRSRAFSRTEFDRRTVVEFEGIGAGVGAPPSGMSRRGGDGIAPAGRVSSRHYLSVS